MRYQLPVRESLLFSPSTEGLALSPGTDMSARNGHKAAYRERHPTEQTTLQGSSSDVEGPYGNRQLDIYDPSKERTPLITTRGAAPAIRRSRCRTRRISRAYQHLDENCGGAIPPPRHPVLVEVSNEISTLICTASFLLFTAVILACIPMLALDRSNRYRRGAQEF